jgi:hypothetical protein
VSFTEKASTTSSPAVTSVGSGTLFDRQHDHAPGFREFDCVADQIGQNLLQAQGVALDGLGRFRVDVHQQLDAFFGGLGDEYLHDPVKDFVEPERPFFQFELAGFDLGKIQDVVDDSQQRIGRALNNLKIMAIFGGTSSLRARSVAAMTPFMGVRISWLILARNSLLARVAVSAISLACLSSPSF